jgi:hypothetical protein
MGKPLRGTTSRDPALKEELMPTMPRSGLARPLAVGSPLTVATLAISMWLAWPDAAGAVSFKLGVDYATGTTPRGAVAADFDRDGWTDLAVVCEGPSAVSILPGRADGSFAPRTDFPTGGAPYSIASADFDGDGLPDLVTADYGAGTISILLGHGDGTFSPPVTLQGHVTPIAVAAGDLNHDGRPDIAVADYNGNVISIWYGVAGGLMGARIDLASGPAPHGIAIGDVTGDGRPDLCVANSGNNTASIFAAHPDGTFDSRFDCAVGAFPFGIETGDLDGDGLADIVTANEGANSITVLRSRIGAVPLRSDVAAGSGPVSTAIGDFDRDGIADLATANSTSGDVTILRGIGAGAFVRDRTMGSGRIPWSVVILDAARDGLPDVVSCNGGGTTVTLLRQDAPLPVAILASLVSVEALADRVRLRWYASGNAGLAATLQRRTDSSDWSDVAALTSDGSGYLAYEDTDVQPGTAYGYRLSIPDGDVEAFAGETWVTTDVAAFALAGARPNPATGGRLAVDFVLPTAEPARIELLDIGGRHVVDREVGSLGVGRHSVDLSGHERLRPAVYLLRLSQGSRTCTTRVAVLD